MTHFSARCWLMSSRMRGFEVVECASAEAAELIVASTGTELRALITDHNLTGEMSGAALAQCARRKHPGMNIILMSGTKVEPATLSLRFSKNPSRPSSCSKPFAIKHWYKQAFWPSAALQHDPPHVGSAFLQPRGRSRQHPCLPDEPPVDRVWPWPRPG